MSKALVHFNSYYSIETKIGIWEKSKSLNNKNYCYEATEKQKRAHLSKAISVFVLKKIYMGKSSLSKSGVFIHMLGFFWWFVIKWVHIKCVIKWVHINWAHKSTLTGICGSQLNMSFSRREHRIESPRSKNFLFRALGYGITVLLLYSESVLFISTKEAKLSSKIGREN